MSILRCNFYYLSKKIYKCMNIRPLVITYDLYSYRSCDSPWNTRGITYVRADRVTLRISTVKRTFWVVQRAGDKFSKVSLNRFYQISSLLRLNPSGDRVYYTCAQSARGARVRKYNSYILAGKMSPFCECYNLYSNNNTRLRTWKKDEIIVHYAFTESLIVWLSESVYTDDRKCCCTLRKMTSRTRFSRLTAWLCRYP